MTNTSTNLITGVGRSAILIGGGLAGLWLTLGILSDGTTYHLAPLLVAAIPVLILAFESSRATAANLLGMSLGGLAVALAITAVLSATDNLAGPSLLPVGGAAFESVAFAVVGGAGAIAVGFLRHHDVSRST